MQGSVSVWVGHVLVALPAYPYLLTDYATVLSVFTHHQWIGGIFIVGGAAHASMALIFDCSVREHPTIVRLVHQRRAVIVHLNWVCIFLGFHSFGLYTTGTLGAASNRMSYGSVLTWLFYGPTGLPTGSHVVYSRCVYVAVGQKNSTGQLVSLALSMP